MLTAIERIVQRLDLNRVYVGLETYDSTASVRFNFNQYRTSASLMTQFRTYITAGVTQSLNTATALRVLVDDMFTARRGDRSNARDWVVLMFRGNAIRTELQSATRVSEIRTQITRLRSRNINTFIMADQSIDRATLQLFVAAGATVNVASFYDARIATGFTFDTVAAVANRNLNIFDYIWDLLCPGGALPGVIGNYRFRQSHASTFLRGAC